MRHTELRSAFPSCTVTVEYGRIEQSHPQLTTLLPSEVVAQYNAQTWRPVDFAVSFSSVEHSGLGRSGFLPCPACLVYASVTVARPRPHADLEVERYGKGKVYEATEQFF